MTATVETDHRRALRREVERGRRAAGLPPTVEDEAALDRIARLLGARGDR